MLVSDRSLVSRFADELLCLIFVSIVFVENM